MRVRAPGSCWVSPNAPRTLTAQAKSCPVTCIAARECGNPLCSRCRCRCQGDKQRTSSDFDGRCGPPFVETPCSPFSKPCRTAVAGLYTVRASQSVSVYRVLLRVPAVQRQTSGLRFRELARDRCSTISHSFLQIQRLAAQGHCAQPNGFVSYQPAS